MTARHLGPDAFPARLAEMTARLDRLERVAGTTGGGGGGASAAWALYGPVFTAATTNPTLGTTGAFSFGRWQQVNRTVTAFVGIGFGSAGASGGAGAYRVSLPAPAAGGVNTICGQGWVFDGHPANAIAPVIAVIRSGGTTLEMRYPAVAPLGASTLVSATTPFSFGSLDSIRLLLTYEAFA